MDRALRDKWTAALRSGAYKKAPHTLHWKDSGETGDSGGYCCLGVLCAVEGLEPHYDGISTIYILPKAGAAVKDSFVVETEEYDDEGTKIVDKYYGEEEFGIPLYTHDELVKLNDQGDNDFNKIANYIEKVL